MFVDSTVLSGKCTCGQFHEMSTKAAYIEAGCLKDFEKILTQHGLDGKRCVLYGENSYAATKGLHPVSDQDIVLPSLNLHADEKSTARVLELMEKDIELLIAIGSGSIHDIARFCAHERKIKFVSVPTAASVDGFCSTVAAMTWYGYKKTMAAVAPEIVIADTDIIKNAPFELVKSGVGDIMAKYTALADWEIAHELTGEYLCRRIYDMMRSAADTVMSSVPGLMAGEAKAYEDVTYALIMSGLAMQMIGNSRPASGCEHHISHMIEMCPAGIDVAFSALHGEKTGVGSVIGAAEYHRLAEIEDIEQRALDYSPLDKDELEAFFGEHLIEGVIQENEKDSLSPVCRNKLISSWPEIRRIVSKIPDAEYFKTLLETLDARRTLEDIGVSSDEEDKILRYSPIVRNRLTLMRVRRMIKN